MIDKNPKEILEYVIHRAFIMAKLSNNPPGLSLRGAIAKISLWILTKMVNRS